MGIDSPLTLLSDKMENFGRQGERTNGTGKQSEYKLFSCHRRSGETESQVKTEKNLKGIH